MKTIATLAAALILAACATQDVQKARLAACNGYTQALETLTVYKRAKKLSKGQIATVDRLRPSLNSACKSDVTDARSALATVESGLTELLLIQGDMK